MTAAKRWEQLGRTISREASHVTPPHEPAWRRKDEDVMQVAARATPSPPAVDHTAASGKQPDPNGAKLALRTPMFDEFFPPDGREYRV